MNNNSNNGFNNNRGPPQSFNYNGLPLADSDHKNYK